MGGSSALVVAARRLVVLAALVFCLLTPLSARAQMAPMQHDTILGMSHEQFMAVGIGVVAGAFVLHAFVGGDLGYFAGAVGGGFLANWWYRNGGEEKMKAAMKPASAEGGVLGPLVLVVGN